MDGMNKDLQAEEDYIAGEEGEVCIQDATTTNGEDVKSKSWRKKEEGRWSASHVGRARLFLAMACSASPTPLTSRRVRVPS